MPFINPQATRKSATRQQIADAATRQIAMLEAQIQNQELMLKTRAMERQGAWDACRRIEAELIAHKAEARVTPQAISNTLQDAYREAQAALRDARSAYLALVRFGGRQIEELRRPILVTK